MRIPGTFVAATLLALGATCLTLAADPRRLAGSYVWDQRGKSGDLEALFTATGEKQWDVAFHFTFKDEDHVYSGTAEGSLTDGEMKGRVLNEQKSRAFTFKGSFADGAFSGTHAEEEDGGELQTGTLTLREVAAASPAPRRE